MHLPNTTHILLNAKERQTTLLQEAQVYRQIRQVMQWRKASPVSQLPSGERGFKMEWRRLLRRCHMWRSAAAVS